jgi:hypothetical protein
VHGDVGDTPFMQAELGNTADAAALAAVPHLCLAHSHRGGRQSGERWA